MKIQSKQNNQAPRRMARGFSLFEMVIVMGIIGLILGGAIYSMGKIRNSAAIGTADRDMQSFETSLEQYRTIGGRFPTTSQGLEALINKPTDSPRPRRWTRTVDDEEALLDPWDTKYKYEFPGTKDSNRPEITSAGPDREFGTDDDQSNQD